jgi:hypothetical protein
MREILTDVVMFYCLIFLNTVIFYAFEYRNKYFGLSWRDGHDKLIGTETFLPQNLEGVVI